MDNLFFPILAGALTGIMFAFLIEAKKDHERQKEIDQVFGELNKALKEQLKDIKAKEKKSSTLFSHLKANLKQS